MNPTDEAAAILTRVFEALARANGKTLNARTRADSSRACELLASAGSEFSELLDDLPRTTPGEAVAAREYATVPPEVERWQRARADADRRKI